MTSNNKNMPPLFESNWFLSESRTRRLFDKARSMSAADMRVPVDADPVVASNYTVEAGVAKINVVGVLTKYPDWLDEVFGFCPSVSLQSQIESAAANAEVKSILLVIDSPGGTVNGTVELAQVIRRINQTVKPVNAYVSGMCCSGGYYLAAQCANIFAAPASEVGSIGVYCVLTDVSKAWEDLGISFTVVSSGKFKGLGQDGKISPEWVADEKRIVDGLHKQFVADIIAGRGMTPEEVAAVADGRTWLPAEAQQLNLIDGVASFDVAFQTFTAPQAQGSIMNKPNAAPQAQGSAAPKNADTTDKVAVDTESADYKAGYDAGYADGKASKDDGNTPADANAMAAAFPGNDSFVLTQLRAGASISKAKAAYADVVSGEMKALRDENARLKSEIKGITGGAAPVAFQPAGPTSTPAASNAPEDQALVEARAKKEWAANKDDCRNEFPNESVYVGYCRSVVGV